MTFSVYSMQNKSRILLLTGIAVGMCGCNVEKLADQMEAHESHFPTGHQEARGGVSYSAKGRREIGRALCLPAGLQWQAPGWRRCALDPAAETFL